MIRSGRVWRCDDLETDKTEGHCHCFLVRCHNTHDSVRQISLEAFGGVQTLHTWFYMISFLSLGSFVIYLMMSFQSSCSLSFICSKQTDVILLQSLF